MQLRVRRFRRLAVFGLVAGILTTSESSPIQAAPKSEDVQQVVDKAVAFLKTKQNADGSFAPKLGGPGITALIAAGLVRNGHANDPVTAKALKYLEGNVQKDGGIYSERLANYTTCIALMALKEANQGGKYNTVIENAQKFLRTLQIAENPDDAQFGGVGYDGKGRPDLSNTHFFVEALVAAGVPKDDPAIKKALTFISRCQNLPGEAQKLDFATKSTPDDKGGFVYNPLMANAKGKKDDRVTAAGGLRSEGGMTYAGLKSFLFAGVGKDDVRVKGAINWIKRHYSLTENPGQKDAGLYYYYHTFAKAMDALGEDEFTDAAGKKHDWRQELFDTLKKNQNADGSWTNSNRAFMENTPELSTAYALLALSYCKK